MSSSKSNRRKTSKGPGKSECAHSPKVSGQERTRFEPRRASGPSIERQRLVEKCTSAAPGGMVLIEAPAGYGKTVLLCQWFRKCRKAGHPIAYISGRDTGHIFRTSRL
jgi:ATP/maltotriose-dependent transcriptional regulator MalT